MEPAKAMVGADPLGRQWQRYGDILSRELALDPDYTEEQCGQCPYGDRCCDLMVTITPYEALGIMSWLRANVPDWRGVLDRVKMRAEAMRDWLTKEDNRTPRFARFEDAIAEWCKRGIKCVFYDPAARGGRGGCSIYPVRPVNCRKVFGRGDCADETSSGIQSMAEDPALRENRAARVRLRELERYGQTTGEMCSLIAMLRSGSAVPIAEPADQRLMHTEPETLTDDQVLWGLGARPMNAWSEEEAHGNT